MLIHKNTFCPDKITISLEKLIWSLEGTEAATRGVLQEMVFLKISQNLQENTCARVSFLIKRKSKEKSGTDVFKCYEFSEKTKHLHLSLIFDKFIKEETLAQVFSYEFSEISKNTFSTEHLWATIKIS